MREPDSQSDLALVKADLVTRILLLAKMWKGDLGLYDLSGGAPRPTWRGGVAGH